MTAHTKKAAHLDNFFMTSSMRLDRWRELNASAQTWAAEARNGKPHKGRAEVDAALEEVRPLEDFFAYPGPRLMKTLSDRIAADDALGVASLVRRMSGSLLSGAYRHDSGEWDASDDAAPAVADRMPLSPNGSEHGRPEGARAELLPRVVQAAAASQPRHVSPGARRAP